MLVVGWVRRGTALRASSPSPTRLFQHLAMLVLPHLLPPFLDDRTQANSCAGLTDELGIAQPPRAGRNHNVVRAEMAAMCLASHMIRADALHSCARGAQATNPPLPGERSG